MTQEFFEMAIAVFRLVPLAICFWVAFRRHKILPAVIAVVYVAAILFGPSLFKWAYAPAVFSTPLAYLVSWYMIKNMRRDNV